MTGASFSSPRPDPNIAQRKAADPTGSVWVSASAGSGKTKVLTDRVLALLLTGSAPEKILCITFTKAAASEMANRLNARLGAWARMDDETLAKEIAAILDRPPSPQEERRARRLFALVLDAPGGLKIQTIHSFCQSLLGRFPIEANTPPHFDVMDERTAAELMQVARDRVLNQGMDDPDLGKALGVISQYVQEDQFNTLLQRISSERSRLAMLIGDGEEPLFDAVARIYAAVGADPALGEDDVVAAACEDGAFDKAGLASAFQVLRDLGTPKNDGAAAARIERWINADAAGRQAILDDYRLAYFTSGGDPRANLAGKKVREQRPDIELLLDRERERLVEIDAAVARQVTAACSAALLTLGTAILAQYQRAKDLRAKLDYDDLILRARDLLRGSLVANPSWVMFKLDGGIDHILVDEAQDTSREQWEVISGLADDFFSGEGQGLENRTIFVVGDVKQSIYSFQRADPDAFDTMRDYFQARIQAAGERFGRVPMEVSFRSTEAVLAAVDATFADDRAKIGLVPPDGTVTHYAHRAGVPGLVELWPVVEKVDGEVPEHWSAPVAVQSDVPPVARLAQGLAEKIAGWIGKEYLPSKGRTVRAGDILVLVRRRTEFVDRLIRELKQRGVTVAGVDRLTLSKHIAVMDLLALGQFLLLPEDDLTLATVLKGPFIGFDDDDLFRLAHDRGKQSLWRRLEAAQKSEGKVDGRMKAAWDWLSGLLAAVDYHPPYELYAHILTQPCPAPVPSHAAVAEFAPMSGRRALISRLGVEAEDPVDEFLSLTLSFDLRRVPSLQGFLHWFAAGEAEIKRDLESGENDALRLMTVHGAKGLQAPIVILPDTVRKPAGGGANVSFYWVDDAVSRAGADASPVFLWPPAKRFEEDRCKTAREAAEWKADQEYRRLLYVAMTRAEDRLYICGYSTEKAIKEGCWYDLVRNGLNGLPGIAEVPFDAGEDWSGDALRLSMGAANEDVGSETAEGAVVTAAAQTSADLTDIPVPDWLFAEPAVEPTPPNPVAPSRPDVEDPPVRSPLADGKGPDGGVLGDEDRFKRGLLIHSLLQFLPDQPAGRRRELALSYLSRPAHGLTEAGRDRMVEEVMAVMDHPDFAAIFGPGSRAEAPIVGVLERASGIDVVSGQIDRLLVTENEVLVVDYKTLRPAPADSRQIPLAYRRQLAGYKGLLQKVFPGKTVKCALLWTDIPSLMPVDDDLITL
ncbi:double-strand break repair helicase AddA [Hwanghaeella grinnelliae]|uniref:DNA 3'-5' helicase n=1 Tax=Hwanghaeella grinnelliae TaxID=2500179 RepID=A0A437QNI5_9PROT|nr:double-strand break repair helicase AddA [Hwanghaeella grinnelliae]RVU36020.1 double-strand break repair helicase AddA [Hwanghaeella grinnelliae]